MAIKSSAPAGLKEITLRGVILGGVITLIFTAANVYLGLKVGLTFATSIPAAVISMAILRYFKNHSIVENNIVQTIASAAGTLSAIIFVLPALVMIGWWQGFPYWTTAAVCLVGGVLGVMYSIPLRRALVTGSDLPFPEGVAAAEVLKVGDTEEGHSDNRGGLKVILVGSLAAALVALVTNLKVMAGTVSGVFRVGAGGTMFSAGLSMALIGVGHLVGLTVGIAMVIGLLISYGVVLPIESAGDLIGASSLREVVSEVFAQDVRMVGAGAIAIAAVWTLVKILGPILKGIKDALVSARTRASGTEVDVTERDIPIQIVGLIVITCMIPIGFLLYAFTNGTALAGGVVGIVTISVIFVLAAGLLVASVCGYMAGLIGASNSPISGVGILVVLAAALLIRAVFGPAGEEQVTALVAYTLFTAAVVFGVATISNDNLQDLKTGQLVGATPWKQQVALVIGVIFGSAVIPPVLELMQTAFGFAGTPGVGEKALAAPQAQLLKDLAIGVFGGSLNWTLIGVGAAIGVLVIIVDEILGARSSKYRLPPLAVGMGMYLPMSVTLMIPLGAVAGALYNKWADRVPDRGEHRRRLGVLLATGLIVGESLFGVLFAAIVAGTGAEEPLALPFIGEGYANLSQLVGVLLFAAAVAWVYRWTRRIASD